MSEQTDVMRLTEAALDELIELYKELFAAEISRPDAREMAVRLITLYEVLSQRLPVDARAPTPRVEPPGQPIGFRMQVPASECRQAWR